MQLALGTGDYRTGESALTGGSKIIQRVARRGVVYVRGAGGSATTDTTNVVSGATLAAVGEAGYPMHCGDYCGHGTAYWLSGAYTWGNSEAVNAQAAGFTYLTGLAGVKTDKVCLFGGSMGATDCLNYYKANPAKVCCIALAIPLLDLNDLSSNDKGFVGSGGGLGTGLDSSMNTLTLPQGTITCNQNMATSGLSASGIPGAGGAANTVNVKSSLGWQKITFTGLADVGGKATFTGCTGGTGTLSTGGGVSQGYGESLVAAYGVAWPTLLSGAQLTANSPQVWAPVAGALTVPTQIWSSDNDPVASNTAACLAWAAAVAAAGGGNVLPTVVSMGNQGHNSLAIDAKGVSAFFNANGGLQ